MNTVTNVGLLVLATGAISDGLSQIKTNLTVGLVLVVIGIVLYGIYEYTPIKPNS